jgi:hypothetical protein
MTNITTHTQERQTKETTIGEQTVKFVMIEGQWITSTIGYFRSQLIYHYKCNIAVSYIQIQHSEKPNQVNVKRQGD